MENWYKFFCNGYVQGFIVEFVAAGIVFFLFGVRYERNKMRKQFYRAIVPTLQSISSVCRTCGVPKEEIKKIVQAISKNFSESFLGSVKELDIKKNITRPMGMPKDCGVCGDTVSITTDSCKDCNLDCCAWDFSTSSQ